MVRYLLYILYTVFKSPYRSATSAVVERGLLYLKIQDDTYGNL